MSWTKRFLDIAVVLAALIGIADQESYRRAGRVAFMDTRKNFDFVRLAPLRDVPRGAGAPPIQFSLDIGFGQGRPGGQPSTTAPIAGP